MIQGIRALKDLLGCIPRESGDDPQRSTPWLPNALYSPRERG